MKKTYSAPSLTVVELGTMTPLANSLVKNGVQIEENETYNPAQTFSVKNPWQTVETGSDEENDF